MPSLQDIEQFKASLKSLGKETETLARWGETWQDLEAPPQGVPDDIAALLAGGDDETGSGEAEAPGLSDDLEALLGNTAGAAPEELVADAEPAQEAGPAGDEDFASFLDGMSLGGSEPAPGPPDIDTISELEAPADEFELPAGFDEPISELEPQADDLEPLESLDEQPPASDAPTDEFELPGDLEETPAEPAEEDFAVPDSLLADFGSLGEPDEGTPGADAPDEADSQEPSGETGLDEADDFSIPDALLEALPGDDTAEAATPDSVDTFGLDDLEALSADEPPSGATDDFAMPDFGGTDAPDGDESPAEELGPADPFGSMDQPAGEAAEPGLGLPDAAAADSGFDLGSESMEGDSFDQFDLGGGAPSVPDLGTDDFAKGPGDDLDGQLASLDGDIPAADNFALDAGWGADFTIPGFEMGTEAKPAAPPKTAKPAAAGSLAGAFGAGSRPAVEKQARPIDLSEEQADALQDTLLSFPLNLRLAVEDIVANSRGTEAQQSDLVWMLVEGASAKDAAKLAGKVLKRYIEVPAGFAKRTGAAFEAEKGSFRYIFFHSILPVLQVLLLVAVGAGALFYLGYTFAYRPIRANSLYAAGHRQIGLSKYGESIEFFNRADKEWSMKGWHYKYAEAYEESGQYPRAESMYERLLQSWPKETKAALDYAGMEHELLAFEKAESVLQTYLLGRDYFNEKGLLLSSQNFLSWADFEQNRYEAPDAATIDKLYEKARLQLATLMERHGRSDGYLELMLLYFIRTERFGSRDHIEEILPLAKYVVENKRSSWSASTLAELGQYLLDRDETEHVNGVLLTAVDRDGTVPEAHAAMARWNRRSGFSREELTALEYAARFFAEAEASTGLSAKRVKAYIDAMMRLGELRRADGRSLDAEDAYNVAIDRYEKALASRQFKPRAEFGRAYSLLADIYYSERVDFPGALSLYAEAEANGYTSPETDYRRGYMHYNAPADDGSAALRYFYRAGLDRDVSPYLMLATANALYARDDFFAAQGYYAMLANRLQFELDTLSLPSPQVKPSHAEIVELLMLTRNNQGAALYRVAERMGDAKRRADAMGAFTESARLFDSLVRDQRSMLRPSTKNLGFLNLDFVLHPLRGIDLSVYKTIPAEMAYPRK